MNKPFDPEKVRRHAICSQTVAGFDGTCVDAKDYDALLERYRGLLNNVENMRDLILKWG